MAGEEVRPAIEPERGDRRFSHAAWTENPMLDFVKQSYLIGGKKVRRVASVGIAATLVDPATGAVLDTAEASRDDADQFAHRDLYRVEAGTYEFVHPAIPGSGWTRIVEPVFVSGIIVGLIYLFFSNQSD